MTSPTNPAPYMAPTTPTVPVNPALNQNELILANQERILKDCEHKKSFRELVGFYKGSIAAVVTFLMTNKVVLFLGGVKQDQFMIWIGKMIGKYPHLEGLFTVMGNTVSFAWNALVADPTLCAAIISGLVALGVTIGYKMKKAKLNKQIKKGNVIITENGVYRKK